MTVPLSKSSRKVNILETSQLSVRRKKVTGPSRDVEDTGEYLRCHLMALFSISLRLQGNRKKSFLLPPKYFPLLKIILSAYSHVISPKLKTLFSSHFSFSSSTFLSQLYRKLLEKSCVYSLHQVTLLPFTLPPFSFPLNTSLLNAFHVPGSVPRLQTTTVNKTQ